jgi:hypothetical protein
MGAIGMFRFILTALALGAALALPVASQASDSQLIELGSAHVQTTRVVRDCAGIGACNLAIARNVLVMRAITRRATARFRTAGDRPNKNACLDAGDRYVAAGMKALTAVQGYIGSGYSTASRRAYLDAAVKLDGTIATLAKLC